MICAALALATVTAVTALAGAERAGACSCIPLELDRQAFRDSDAAIIGKLVAKHPVGDFQADYRFRVERVFRGRHRLPVGRVFSVRSSSEGASCGYETGIGHRTGLLLDRRRGEWTGNLCATAPPRVMRRAAEREGFSRTLECGS